MTIRSTRTQHCILNVLWPGWRPSVRRWSVREIDARNRCATCSRFHFIFFSVPFAAVFYKCVRHKNSVVDLIWWILLFFARLWSAICSGDIKNNEQIRIHKSNTHSFWLLTSHSIFDATFLCHRHSIARGCVIFRRSRSNCTNPNWLIAATMCPRPDRRPY